MLRLDGSRWWHTPYVLPVIDGMPGPARKICAPYDGAHLFRLWKLGEPEAPAAVDPQAGSSGTPPTRV